MRRQPATQVHAAHVPPTIPQPIERSLRRRRMRQQQLTVGHSTQSRTFIAPFVGKAKEPRPRAAKTGDAHIPHAHHTPIDVASEDRVRGEGSQIVIAGHPQHRRTQGSNALQHLRHRSQVGRVLLRSAVALVAQLGRANVPDQKHRRQRLRDQLGAHLFKVLHVSVHIADDGVHALVILVRSWVHATDGTSSRSRRSLRTQSG